MPLPQLRQVLLAGESTQIAQEDQDRRSAAQIFQAATLAARVGEAQRGRRKANAHGHSWSHVTTCRKPTNALSAMNAA